jgi:hypothetical protein
MTGCWWDSRLMMPYFELLEIVASQPTGWPSLWVTPPATDRWYARLQKLLSCASAPRQEKTLLSGFFDPCRLPVRVMFFHGDVPTGLVTL